MTRSRLPGPLALALFLAAAGPASARAPQGGAATAPSAPTLEPTWFGVAVDGAGDVDLDGCDDVVVGLWWHAVGGEERGRAIVFSGRSGKKIHDFEGEEPGALYGLSVAGAGDVDDDGAGDFVVGAPLAEVKGRPTGVVYLYSGRKGELVRRIEGDRKARLFGLSVAGAGDVNQDGFDDVVVGAPGGDLQGGDPTSGRVFVYSGKKAKELHEWKAERDDERFGWSVDGAGDVNGDGSQDVIVGSWGRDLVRVFSGSNGKLLQELEGSPGGGHYGFSVAGAGDVDQDGMADVIVGIPRGEKTGAIAISVKRERDLLSWPRELGKGREAWSFGISVDGAGDVNGDGFADLVVGDPGFPDTVLDPGGGFLSRAGQPAPRPGAAYVYSGQDGALLFGLEGEQAGDRFGVRVRGAGDVDQDGLGDVVVASGRGAKVLVRVHSGRGGKLLLELEP